MDSLLVRAATLDDTAAIAALHTAAIERWQRLNEQGDVEDVPYSRLTLFERWLHGGPWMSVETCAVHLTHLLRGAGFPIVAEVDGRVVGHAEAFHGEEPPPFGNHLHISVLYVHADRAGQGVERALLEYSAALARELKCQRVCLASPEAQEFYAGVDWRLLSSSRHINWPARPGQVFYQAVPHLESSPAQIRGWAMPLGRRQSAWQEWVTRWPDLWAAVPGLREQRIERLRFMVAGSPFFVMYAQSPYEPRWTSVYLWSATPPTGPMMTAVSDQAYKLGYRRLDAVVAEGAERLLGADVEPEGANQEIYCFDL